jgi:putative flippase GtrA
LFDLALLFFFTTVLNIHYLVAAGTAFLIAVSCNYLLSRRFVFKGTDRGAKVGYVNFLLIAGTGLCFVVGSMYVLVALLSLNYVFARISVAGLTGLWNYLMNLYFNFKMAGKY